MTDQIILFLNTNKYFISKDMKDKYIVEQCTQIFDILINKNYQTFDNSNSNLLYFAGLLYGDDYSDLDNCIFKKYYFDAIKLGNYDAIVNMSLYNKRAIEKYERYIENINGEFKNIINMLSVDDLICTGSYHQEQNAYDKMIIYYHAACEKGSVEAMQILASHFELIKDYHMMKIYYKIAALHDNIKAMLALAEHYKNPPKQEFDLRDADFNPNADVPSSFNTRQMLKYYSMAAEKGDLSGMLILGEYYADVEHANTKKYYLMAIEKILNNMKDSESNNNEVNNKKEKDQVIKAMEELAKYFYRTMKYEDMEKYYLMAYEHGSVSALTLLGKKYSNLERYDDMERIYLIGVERGDISAMVGLGARFYYAKNYERMEYYYMMAYDKGESRSLYTLIENYLNLNRGEDCERIYNIAINKGDKNAIFKFAVYYIKKFERSNNAYNTIIDKSPKPGEYEQYQIDIMRHLDENNNNFNSVEKYFNMAIENGDVDAMIELGDFYKSTFRYNDMIRYYLLAIENGRADYTLVIAYHYRERHDIKNMRIYHSRAIEMGVTHAIPKIREFYTPINLYELLNEVQNKTEIVKEKIKELEDVLILNLVQIDVVLKNLFIC